MDRIFIEKLREWRQRRNRKPLVLSGARQVGKTWLLKEFGKSDFKSVAYVSLDSSESARALFDGDFDLKSLLAGLQAVSNSRIEPEDTLIVLDEIQTCPKALKSLKYWQEEAPQYVIAAAGSLIGLMLMEGTGYPVGKTNSMTLYPLTFSEYLCAVGDGKLAELVNCGNLALTIPFHDRLSRRLKEYLFVGGMPAVVAAFTENWSFPEVRQEQEEILSDYSRDFGKHAPKELLGRIKALWRSLPVQLAKEDKRFVAAEVDLDNGREMRARDARDPFEWLEAAGLVHRVWNVSKPAIPLESYRNHLFKLFGLDVGLLGAQSHLDARSVVEGNRIFTEFKGALTEQFVQQELRAVVGVTPFFWAEPGSRAEVDFIAELNGDVVPIEVKAETNLRAKSLRVFRDKYSPKVSVRTSLAGYAVNDGLIDIPLYAMSALRNVIS